MQQPEIWYIYDPLCGWCYGFSPVIRQLHKHYGNRVQFSVMSGGLSLGTRAVAIAKAHGYIARALGIVEQTTGVLFGDGFKQLLQEGTYIYNSEPPCIAMTVFRELYPNHVLDFAHALQHALFYEGKSLNDENTYRELLTPYHTDTASFMSKLASEHYRTATYEEFAAVQRMGAGGFPTVLYTDNSATRVLARGYQPYKNRAELVEMLLHTQP